VTMVDGGESVGRLATALALLVVAVDRHADRVGVVASGREEAVWNLGYRDGLAAAAGSSRTTSGGWTGDTACCVAVESTFSAAPRRPSGEVDVGHHEGEWDTDDQNDFREG
jgi:hypothetical protein